MACIYFHKWQAFENFASINSCEQWKLKKFPEYEFSQTVKTELEGIKQQAKISPRIVFGKNLKSADLQIG